MWRIFNEMQKTNYIYQNALLERLFTLIRLHHINWRKPEDGNVRTERYYVE